MWKGFKKISKIVDKKCNTSSYPSECPDGVKCSETTTEKDSRYNGECTCIGDHYEFNINYKDDSDYCTYVEPKNFDNRVMEIKSSTTSEEVSDPIRPQSSHHIIGGILISICLVVIFTLIVIGVKKLQIKQRIRNMRMTQRNRPMYEDVMMGNDNDDPPLI